ncbi:MAG: hypothetical protein J5496_09550 [Lachnospiraceae bacterium]|nr:hypothetical protein [Lachnospiraceae bacterium]
MKKVFALLAALTLILSLLAACGTQANETTPAPTQAPTEAPTEAPTTAPATDDLAAAKDYIFAMYNSKALATPADYQVTSVVAIAGVRYEVSWSVEITSGPADGVKVGAAENNQVTIDVNEKTPEDVAYNLVATVKDAAGKTATTSFPHTIPAYKEFTWDEYVAAKEGDTVVVKGVISATMSKTRGNSANCLYLQDADGGYYVYNMADDPDAAGYVPGMTVRVTGSRSTYSGTYEIMNASVEVLENGPAELEVVDLTDLYANAASLKDAELTKLQAKLVTVKGVEITGQDTGSGYYKFKLGSLESYARISSSVCPLTKEEQTQFTTAHGEHLGWIANVTGVLCVYDGAFYVTPATVDAFEYVGLPEKSDAEKVAYEADLIVIPEKITEDTAVAVGNVGQSYESVAIAFSADNECVAVEDGKLIFTCPDADTEVTIKAVLTSGAEVLEKEFKVLVEAAATDVYVAEIVDAPVAGEAYKLVLFQNMAGGVFYFNGEASGDRYLATTEKADKAVDVFLEEAEGGYKLYFLNGEEKTYIEIGLNENGKTAAQLKAESELVAVWNEEFGTLFCDVNGTNYYLGAYNAYTTISVSDSKYISGENAANIGISQFPAHLCKVAPAQYKNNIVEAPEADKAYKLVLFQNAAGGVFYFNGEASGNRYLGSTEKADKAVDVFLEEAEGGFKLYFLNGEEKTYIEIGLNGDGKTAAMLKAESDLVAAWDADAKTLMTTVDGTNYYLGSYKTYTTFSVSDAKYISGENAAQIDISQFPSRLVELELVKTDTKVVEEPEADKAYKLVLFQALAGGTFYFDGEASGDRYLSSTDKLSKAVDVFLEAVEGGFKLYFMNGEEKTYIEIGLNGDGKTAAMLKAETDLVAVWNADAKTLMTTIDGTNYYLGSYKTYTTFSVSDAKYISGENAAQIDISQFPSRLVLIEAE